MDLLTEQMKQLCDTNHPAVKPKLHHFKSLKTPPASDNQTLRDAVVIQMLRHSFLYQQREEQKPQQ